MQPLEMETLVRELGLSCCQSKLTLPHVLETCHRDQVRKQDWGNSTVIVARVWEWRDKSGQKLPWENQVRGHPVHCIDFFFRAVETAVCEVLCEAFQEERKLLRVRRKTGPNPREGLGLPPVAPSSCSSDLDTRQIIRGQPLPYPGSWPPHRLPAPLCLHPS